jgi:hypothetical protein
MNVERQDQRAFLGRLEKVERENRRLKLLGLAVLALAGVAFLTAETLPAKRTLETEELVIRGGDGAIRARLGFTPQEAGPVGGSLALRLFDGEGKIRAGLAVLKDGSVSLFLNGKLGSVSGRVEADGSPSLALIDKNSVDRAKLGLDKDGSTSLSFTDAERSPRAVLELDASGSPRLSFNDELHRARAVLGSTSLEAPATGEASSRPTSSLVLFDKDGKVIWSAP